MARKKIAANAVEWLGTENQSELNRKDEVYSGEETKYFFAMILQSCSN